MNNLDKEKILFHLEITYPPLGSIVINMHTKIFIRNLSLIWTLLSVFITTIGVIASYELYKIGGFVFV